MSEDLNTTVIAEVQGPPLPLREPRTALVQIDADLFDKYLGRGLIGYGPTLEVLNNKSADDLLRQHGYDLYRRMVVDSEVDASLDVLVQSATAGVMRSISPLEPSDPDYRLSSELADFINWVFEHSDIDEWRREQLRAALTFGNAVSELDWDYIESGVWKGHLAIHNLRLQRPENYGFIVDSWGIIYGVAPLGQALGMQFPLGNLIPLSSAHGIKNLIGAVPRHKLTIWTWEQEGTDPRGTSILQPAYIPWWNKHRTLEEWSCWLGRFAQPSLWATPGPDAIPLCITNPDGSQTITNPTEALLQALLNFKSASVLALPYGSILNVIEATGSAQPFLDAIDAFNKEITRAILGQHLATSEGDNQSRAAAEVHSTVLRQLINSVRRWIAKRVQKDIIEPMIQANYGDVGRLMPVVDTGEGDGWELTPTEIFLGFQSGFWTEDQLPSLDKRLGVPVRKTNYRVGPGNLPPASSTPEEPSNAPENSNP